MIKGFMEFLKEFNIVSLAIAFIMGSASTSLVNSLVKDILMPLLSSLISSESWKIASIYIGGVKVAYGSFLAELINFLILALIVFIIAKKILKMESIPKK